MVHRDIDAARERMHAYKYRKEDMAFKYKNQVDADSPFPLQVFSASLFLFRAYIAI